MTLLTDRPADTEVEGPDRPPQWLAAALGCGAGVSSFVLLLVPTLLLWHGDPHSSGRWQAAAGLAAATWLATLGAHVSVAGATISFVPLLLAVIPVALLAWSWHWFLLRRGDDDEMVADLLPRNVLRSLGLWWIGYAVSVALAVGLTFLGPARPSWMWLGAALLLPPALGAGLATARLGRWDGELLGARLDGSMVPETVRRALWPALKGVGLLVLLGVGLLASAVALHWDAVTAVRVAVGGGTGAALTLGVLQVAALPNLALWVVSFLAGPGFSVVQGASVDWSGAKTGLMPLVPVLAAHPQPAVFPWWVSLAVLLPVGVGTAVGRWSLRTVARLSSVRTKVSVALVAAWLTAAAVAALDVLGGSSLGAYRLADIGAPAGMLLLTLGVELALGALLVVLWDAWRLRR